MMRPEEISKDNIALRVMNLANDTKFLRITH